MLFRMLRRAHRILPALPVALVLAACADDPAQPVDSTSPPVVEVRSIPQPLLPTVNASAPMLQTCGAPVTYAMWGDMDVPGTVTVENDAETLYVTYTVSDSSWFISDTRLAVERSAQTIPRNPDGSPNPWAFSHIGEHEPVTKAYTYALPLTEVGATFGDEVVISAMAGVVYPTTGDWSGPWEWRTAWAVTESAGTREMVLTYTITGCAGAPAPPPPAQGVITLTFDDGWLTTYTNVYPVLQELGLRGNVAVNPDAVDGLWTTYMHLPEIRELHDAGWAVVSHSMSHRDLTSLSDAELDRELRESKAWIQSNGFRGASVFIVPFHSWGARERAAVEQYYTAARGYTVTQFWPERMEPMPADGFDLTGYEPEYAPFTTAEGRDRTMAYVERAIAEGEFVDLFFHKVTSEQVPAFRALMERLAQRSAYVSTYDEIF